MSGPSEWTLASFDGVELHVTEMGEGRPLILLHGLFSNAQTNWIRFGHAERLADAGFRVVMPDLRAHGKSAAPHDADAYPDDVLCRDARALIERLDVDGYDLGGFSLGARTAAKLLTDGLRPRRAILAGMGLEGLTGWQQRQRFFLDAIDKRDTAKHGDRHWMAIQFMKSQKVDTVAAAHLLSSFSDVPTAAFSDVPTETLVLCGREDRDNGDPQALADALPNGRHEAVPGTHMSSVAEPDLGEAMVRFLKG